MACMMPPGVLLAGKARQKNGVMIKARSLGHNACKGILNKLVSFDRAYNENSNQNPGRQSREMGKNQSIKNQSIKSSLLLLIT